MLFKWILESRELIEGEGYIGLACHAEQDFQELGLLGWICVRTCRFDR